MTKIIKRLFFTSFFHFILLIIKCHKRVKHAKPFPVAHGTTLKYLILVNNICSIYSNVPKRWNK